MTAAFENGGEAGQIGIDVGEWVDQRISNTGLRAEMNNMRKAKLFEQVCHPIAVGKVQFHEAKPSGFGELRTARLLQTWVIIGIHVVEADDVVPISQETSRDVESNKSCRAGHQNRTFSHARPLEVVSN